ncbi:helix-turn-helix domain-containing protein [Kribbella italica]|uniref:Schlafen AlbA-2 domain-containing protein n=1 Tax=Kribbella italica TaxID=1540520 RepID=A0A7W9J0E2_9ACTN|nr:ATP-binding protein [Kribbella italica]MBB5833318.1 hypothetical protein [Kribbella italica]
MLDEAVSLGVTETEDLDWKKQLPPSGGLPKTDFPKDIAARANSGGGVIVFGVAEEAKAAVGRVDAGPLSENHERALRKAAYNAITPPVFGLGICSLGAEGRRAVVVVVPPSVDGPHLIYRDEMFGASIRNDADTEWMKERQIEAMYRARLDERRRSGEALAALYDQAAGRSTAERAWIVSSAPPGPGRRAGAHHTGRGIVRFLGNGARGTQVHPSLSPRLGGVPSTESRWGNALDRACGAG